LHSGKDDAKFSQLLFNEIKHWRIPHYGCGGDGPNSPQIKTEESGEFFTVKNPSLVNGSYVAYLIVGRDRFGSFEGKRRYNEFYLIRNSL